MRRDNKWKYVIIFLIVILIVIGVYFKYFQTKKIIEDFEVDFTQNSPNIEVLDHQNH